MTSSSVDEAAKPSKRFPTQMAMMTGSKQFPRISLGNEDNEQSEGNDDDATVSGTSKFN